MSPRILEGRGLPALLSMSLNSRKSSGGWIRLALLADPGLGGEARCQLDLEVGLGAAGSNPLLDLKEDVVGNILAGTRRRVGAAAARNVGKRVR